MRSEPSCVFVCCIEWQINMANLSSFVIDQNQFVSLKDKLEVNSDQFLNDEERLHYLELEYKKLNEEVVVDDVITAPSSSSKKVDDKDLPPIVFVTLLPS